MQVLGTYADYYVFETTMKEQPEEEEETLGKHYRKSLIGSNPLQSSLVAVAACMIAATFQLAEATSIKHGDRIRMNRLT